MGEKLWSIDVGVHDPSLLMSGVPGSTLEYPGVPQGLLNLNFALMTLSYEKYISIGSYKEEKEFARNILTSIIVRDADSEVFTSHGGSLLFVYLIKV